MALIWTDGTWTAASAVSGFKYENPIPGDSTPYILRQDFVVRVLPTNNFSAVAVGTAHPTETGFYLCEETQREDIGGGMVRWTRVYAKKPAEWDDYESVQYTFPGYMGVIVDPRIPFTSVAAGVPIGREPRTLGVACRVAHKYYRIAASGGDYTTPGGIPSVDAFEPYFTTVDQKCTYLADGPTSTPPGIYAVSSTPDRTTYEGYVTNGTEIAIEDSKIARWMGPFWLRTVRYVKAR